MPNKEVCEPILDKVDNITSNLYVYDLLRPIPDGALGQSRNPDFRVGKTVVGGVEKTYKRGYTMAEYTPWVKKNPLANKDLVDNHVLGAFVSDYANDPVLRKILHIPDYVQAWSMCSDVIDYNLQNEASQWIYNLLKGTDIRMLFFSGDSDAAVATEGSRLWIEELGWKVKTKWQHWKTGNQVSGFWEQYEGGLDFATIRGVGHMAPQWARPQAQQMFTNWIHGKPLGPK